MNLEMSKKTDCNVGYTRVNCIGYGSRAKAYLFWSDNKDTFVQKFEYLQNYNSSLQKFKPIKIIDTIFFSYYDKNYKNLENEIIKHFKFDSKNTQPNAISTGYISRVHSCHRKFKIKTNETEFSKEFDFFDVEEFDKKKVYASKRNYTKEEIKKWEERGWEGMETEMIHENHPKRNINYELNKELKLVEWDRILTEFIKKLESENKFELIKAE